MANNLILGNFVKIAGDLLQTANFGFTKIRSGDGSECEIT